MKKNKNNNNNVVDSGVPMIEVEDVEYLGDYKLWLRFNDGLEGSVNLKKEVDKPPYRKLRNLKKFVGFGLERGTLVWSDDLDIAPEILHSMAEESHINE